MSLAPAELEAAVRGGDATAVRELMRGATEAERAACAKALKQFLTGPKWHAPELVMLRPQQFADFMASGFQDLPAALVEQERQQRGRNLDYDAWRQIANGLAFQLAALGLAGGVAAAARVASDFPWQLDFRANIDLVAGVLADRRPSWLADLIDRCLRNYPGGIAAWPLARTLVRLGAIARPDVPEYTTLMPGGVVRTEPDGTRARPRSAAGLRAALVADPGLLEDEVWRLFTVSDAGMALERADDGAEYWSSALAQLSADGLLDRGRLLDSCLGAFTRDFNPNRVSWYAGFLQELQPTDDEMSARVNTYLGLLAARSKVGVSIGQDGLGHLLAAGRLDAGQLLPACAPALLFKQKRIAIAQLKLIELAAANQPGFAAQAAATVSVAFGHERQDIQEAALRLIRKLGVPAGEPLAVIRRHAADLSGSMTAEATALGLLEALDHSDQLPEYSIDGQAHIDARIAALAPAVAQDLTWALAVARAGEVPGPPRTMPQAGAPLPEPVTDPDELIQLLAILIEDARDALAAERALAGAVRLSTLPRQQRARIAAPLLKRAQQVMRSYEPFTGELITSDMALVAHTWAGEELPAAEYEREVGSYKAETFAVSGSGRALTMAGIFSARAWEAARLVEAGQGGELLAEPETERGAISAQTLLGRVRKLAVQRWPVCAHDQDVALLRLAPEPAEELWTELGRLTGRPAGALRETHRLIHLPVTFEAVTGLPSGRPLRHSHYWHEHLLARVVGDVPMAPENGCWQLLTGLPDPLVDHEVLYGPSRYELRHYDAAVAGWALICPWQPEVAAAHLLRPLSDGLISGLTPATTAIHSIRHPGHQLGPVGHLALVTGLSADAGDTRIAAAEMWSAACADGRLDPQLAARAIVRGVAGEVLKASRIADSLQHASHSALSAYRTVETVCAAAAGFAPYYPTGMHALLELAARLGARVGTPELPAAVREIAARHGSTRLVTTARQLVGASRGTAPERGMAIEQALAAHLQRAGEP